jgi:hypothetical protein
MKQDDKEKMHPIVSTTRPINNNEKRRKEMPGFETSILFHNLGLPHLGMSIGCSFSSVLDDELSEKATQYQNQAYQCLRKSFLLSAKTITDCTAAITATSIQLLCCYDMSLQYRSMILFIHNNLQMFDPVHS